MGVAKIIFDLEEALNYSVPSSPEMQLYDFYVLSYCATLPSDPTATDQMGRNQASFIARTGVKEDIDYAFGMLLPPLKQELLNAVFFSVCAEMRHITDKKQSSNLVRGLSPGQKKLLQAYTKEISVRDGNVSKLFRRRDSRPIPKQGVSGSYDMSYRSAMKAIKAGGHSMADFISMARTCFREGQWGSMFGGEAWGNICDGWSHLNAARSVRDMATYIDHVYDLQHNTDTVFNKVSRYTKDGSFSWIKKALDLKASVANIAPLLSKCSSYAKKIGYAAMKMAGIKPPEPPASKKPVDKGPIAVGDTVKILSGPHVAAYATVMKVTGNDLSPGNILVDILDGPSKWVAHDNIQKIFSPSSGITPADKALLKQLGAGPITPIPKPGTLPEFLDSWEWRKDYSLVPISSPSKIIGVALQPKADKETIYMIGWKLDIATGAQKDAYGHKFKISDHPKLQIEGPMSSGTSNNGFLKALVFDPHAWAIPGASPFGAKSTGWGKFEPVNEGMTAAEVAAVLAGYGWQTWIDAGRTADTVAVLAKVWNPQKGRWNEIELGVGRDKRAAGAFVVTKGMLNFLKRRGVNVQGKKDSKEDQTNDPTLSKFLVAWDGWSKVYKLHDFYYDEHLVGKALVDTKTDTAYILAWKKSLPFQLSNPPGHFGLNDQDPDGYHLGDETEDVAGFKLSDDAMSIPGAPQKEMTAGEFVQQVDWKGLTLVVAEHTHKTGSTLHYLCFQDDDYVGTDEALIYISGDPPADAPFVKVDTRPQQVLLDFLYKNPVSQAAKRWYKKLFRPRDREGDDRDPNLGPAIRPPEVKMFMTAGTVASILQDHNWKAFSGHAAGGGFMVAVAPAHTPGHIIILSTAPTQAAAHSATPSKRAFKALAQVGVKVVAAPKSKVTYGMTADEVRGALIPRGWAVYSQLVGKHWGVIATHPDVKEKILLSVAPTASLAWVNSVSEKALAALAQAGVAVQQ